MSDAVMYRVHTVIARTRRGCRGGLAMAAAGTPLVLAIIALGE